MDSKGSWQFITDWKKKISGLRGRMSRGNWIILLCVGLILMILAVPSGNKTSQGEAGDGALMFMEGTGAGGGNGGGNSVGGNGIGAGAGSNGTGKGSNGTGKGSIGASGNDSDGSGGNDERSGSSVESWSIGGGSTSSPSASLSYEQQLEARVKEVLSQGEGVGEVDLMIILKSSSQKVYQTDGKSSLSSTKEQDTAGGTRDIQQEEKESTTVILDGSQEGPLLEMELYPEVAGIVISAQGGGTPAIQNEITEAMEALFGLPAHKIKVLKRN